MAKRSLSGLSVIVTGASAGIGRELVLQLTSAGARCVATARREEPLAALAEEVRRAAGNKPAPIEIVVGDVTDPAVRQAMRDRAVETFGGLDSVINNAGVGAFGRFDESNEDRLRQIMEVNFFAVAEMIRESLPLLKQGQRSIIVNVGSILSHRAIPRMNEYCCSKFALRALSESLRVELKSLGIDVLLVSPGTTETDFYDQVIHGRGDVPWNKGKGVTAKAVAQATVRAMQRGKREIIPNRLGSMLVWANQRVPSIVDRVMQKYA